MGVALCHCCSDVWLAWKRRHSTRCPQPQPPPSSTPLTLPPPTALHSSSPFDSVDGGSGTWQQYMVVSEACLLAVPDAVNDEAAAQVGGGRVLCVIGLDGLGSCTCFA